MYRAPPPSEPKRALRAVTDPSNYSITSAGRDAGRYAPSNTLEKAHGDWTMPLQVGEALILAPPEHSMSRPTDHMDSRPMS
jgi:hypothetical protein